MPFNDATSRLDIGRVIEARLVAQWVDSDSAQRTAIQFPSVLGLVGIGGTILSEPPTGADWIKLDIIDDDAEPFCFGGTSGMNRCTGLIQVMVFSPKQAGSKQVLTLGGLLKPIFNRYHASGLKCEASNLRTIDGEKGWNRAIVQTPFTYFEEVTT